ncbi:MAG: family 1 glycosylhydrolase [Actinomycetota bacterium]
MNEMTSTQAERAFPEGFLWGSAGCAHQTEGNNTNSDWWEHELAPDTIAGEPSGMACDSYNRFAEDWRLVAESGQNSVRFSVEWARIEPEPGVFSSEAIDHYRQVIGTARDLGLKTCVSLHHFTSPIWFAREGGWSSDGAVELFRRYVREVAGSMGDLLEIVSTINEPNIVASMGYVAGYFPPRQMDLMASQRAIANLIKAHAATVEELRAKANVTTGLPLSVMDYVAGNDSAEAQQVLQGVRHVMVGVWLEALRTGWIRGLAVPDVEVPGLAGADDFIGVQYYTRIATSPAAMPAEASERDDGAPAVEPYGERTTQMGFGWHPAGLGRVLDQIAEVGLPLIITENGIATDDDEDRKEFVRLHLEQVLEAITRGVDVRGYYYWSLLDNFEWNFGYMPKFGLIAVDRATMERVPKSSLRWYGSVARANRLD